MNISIAVMAHPSRTKEAQKLFNKLNKMPFHGVALVVDNGGGEWETGVRSLKAHVDSDWHLVIQDDAIISDSFYENVLNAIKNVPSESLISFYTGKVRPYKASVNKAVSRAASKRASWITSVSLFWGVCIAIPTSHIEPVLTFTENRKEVYDARIGRYYLTKKLPVYYTQPSLVDHNYKLGSLIGNDKGEPRVAHNYQPLHEYHWNKNVVQL